MHIIICMCNEVFSMPWYFSFAETRKKFVEQVENQQKPVEQETSVVVNVVQL